MTAWPTISLGDAIELFDSRRRPLSGMERASRQGSYPYYGASGVIDYIDDYIFDGRYLLIAEDGENLNSRRLPVAFFADGQFWVNNHAHIVRGKKDVLDDVFLQQWFAQADISGYITGAAQPKLSQANLKRIELQLPGLETQRKIAAILSAYDDLIENNNRRIKLLEETTNRIYREWFVDFRYPGHEDGPLVTSELGTIPDGWRIDSVGDHVDVIRGRSYRGVDIADEGGVPFFNLKCVARDGGFRREGIKRYIGEFKESQKASAGDIIVAVTDMTQERRIVARAARVPDVGEEFGVFSMDLVKVVPTDLPGEHVLGLLRYSEFPDRVKAHANGANVLHLHPDRIREYRFAAPVLAVARQYADQVGPMQHLSDRLEAASERLRGTRDLLLARLVTGAIDVTDLDIAVPELAT